MKRWVVDTNVLVVANGRNDDGINAVTDSCRESTIEFLIELHDGGIMLMDSNGEIQEEYSRYLNPNGQPGVGDRFYQSILQRAKNIVWVDIPKNADGNFADLPSEVVDAGFDPSDRKFAAMSVKEGVPVANATDSDWANDKELLECHGVQIMFLCGCDPSAWRC